MSYRFAGEMYCPIAKRRCPLTEAGDEYCVFGEGEETENGVAYLTSCDIRDLVVRMLCAMSDDEGIPISVVGDVVVVE